jgi:2-iminobutanoate/2-iminopropanoate deaminase
LQLVLSERDRIGIHRREQQRARTAWRVSANETRTSDMATREVVTGLGVPTAIGPYSPAVRASGLLFVSGQPGVDPETGQPAGTTFAEQARQTFRNLDAVLRAGGSRRDLVVNTTVLVADTNDFAELNELYGKFFATDPPARMTSQTPLPRGLLISIGCVALVEPTSS